MEGRRGGVRQGKQGQLGGRGPSRMGGISSWQEEGRKNQRSGGRHDIHGT